MDVRLLDMTQDPRRAQFDYFRTLANPYVGLTVPVDVTALRAWTERTGSSFFLCFLQKTGPAGSGAEKPAAQSAHLPAARARFARRRTKNAKLCTLPQAPPSSAGILCNF